MLGWVGVGVGLLVGFIGIVLGAISISRSRQARASILPGVLAIVVGSVQVLAVIAYVLLQLMDVTGPAPTTGTNPGDTDQERTVEVGELAVGNCLSEMDRSGGPLTQVPCAQAHAVEVVYQFDQAGDAYPGEDALYEASDETCYPIVANAVPTDVDPTALYQDAFVPTLEQWDGGLRTITCVLWSEDTTMTGSTAAGDLDVQ